MRFGSRHRLSLKFAYVELVKIQSKQEFILGNFHSLRVLMYYLMLAKRTAIFKFHLLDYVYYTRLCIEVILTFSTQNKFYS